MNDIKEKLQEIFRDVFEEDALVIRDDMSSIDVKNWDSLAHINMIIAVEKKFGVKFAVSEISQGKEAGQTVGDFIRLLEKKLAK
jgi:acyl carrier protein